MWKELKQWEERHDAIAFGVMTTQEVIGELEHYIWFDKSADGNDHRYICRPEDVRHSLIVEAMKHASNTILICGDSEYQQIMDQACSYIKDALLAEISAVQKLNDKHEVGNPSFYDDVTKKYYKWKELKLLMKVRQQQGVQ